MTTVNRKKILYVITKSVWGGAGKYVYDLATSLPKERFEPVVVFGGKGLLAEKLEESGIRTITIPSLQRDVSILGDIKSFFAFLSVFRKEKPDIVHVNSSKAGGLGALAARLLGTRRIIFTCHGWPFNEERNTVSLLTIRLLSWFTILLSHKTIAVSARDDIDGREMLGASHKVTMVHNGIRMPLFKERNVAWAFLTEIAEKAGMEINAEDYLVGANGELHKNKGYEYLLTAFAEFKVNFTQKRPKLIIISEGEERKKLETKRDALGLSKDVAFVGFIKDAPTYLKAFDAFVLTSIKEGLPYVVIEAGFAGLPVVATNVGGVKEIIDDMQSGILVQTRKPEDVAKGLEFIALNKDKAASFGSALKEKVEKEFSIEHMTENTIAVYDSRL